ncbi:rCG44081, isoform CRA_b [Rattus norvegicus]|uniref:RCG44081, isoform CRA_b n=1 Tax=Rattus norvegicus TaxID=10116 RepID=A6J6S0_RAT|nr:rCG44081, isoform CRA_b [Rattus norvegicus]
MNLKKLQLRSPRTSISGRQGSVCTHSPVHFSVTAHWSRPQRHSPLVQARHVVPPPRRLSPPALWNREENSKAETYKDQDATPEESRLS